MTARLETLDVPGLHQSILQRIRWAVPDPRSVRRAQNFVAMLPRCGGPWTLPTFGSRVPLTATVVWCAFDPWKINYWDATALVPHWSRKWPSIPVVLFFSGSLSAKRAPRWFKKHSVPFQYVDMPLECHPWTPRSLRMPPSLDDHRSGKSAEFFKYKRENYRKLERNQTGTQIQAKQITKPRPNHK